MKKIIVGIAMKVVGLLSIFLSSFINENEFLKYLCIGLFYVGSILEMEGLGELDDRIKKLERKIEDEKNAF